MRETNSILDARLKAFLDDVFTHDSSTFISFTSHSGAIGSILRVLGHREFRLQTGGAIPVLVKAETITGNPPVTSLVPSTSASACAVNPTPTHANSVS